MKEDNEVFGCCGYAEGWEIHPEIAVLTKTPESHKQALGAMKMCQIEVVNE